MSEAWYTFMDVDFPWKMKHSTKPYGFALPPPSPYLPYDPIPNYLYIFIFKGEDLAWGILHVAGRGLPFIGSFPVLLIQRDTGTLLLLYLCRDYPPR